MSWPCCPIYVPAIDYVNILAVKTAKLRYYVYFEPASANHNQRPRLQKSNGRPEFNKLNDQLACSA